VRDVSSFRRWVKRVATGAAATGLILFGASGVAAAGSGSGSSGISWICSPITAGDPYFCSVTVTYRGATETTGSLLVIDLANGSSGSVGEPDTGSMWEMAGVASPGAVFPAGDNTPLDLSYGQNRVLLAWSPSTFASPGTDALSGSSLPTYLVTATATLTVQPSSSSTTSAPAGSVNVVMSSPSLVPAVNTTTLGDLPVNPLGYGGPPQAAGYPWAPLPGPAPVAVSVTSAGVPAARRAIRRVR